MPKKTGVQTTIHIRKIFKNTTTPILFSSANGSEEDIKAYKKYGASDFFGKPIKSR